MREKLSHPILEAAHVSCGVDVNFLHEVLMDFHTRKQQAFLWINDVLGALMKLGER